MSLGLLRKRSPVIALSVVALFAIASAASGQTKETGRESSANVLERSLCGGAARCTEDAAMEILSEGAVSGMMSDLLMLADLPGGFAALPDYSDARHEFKASSSRLKDLLDSIVLAEPRYKWEMEQGIINVVPVNDYPLLDFRIAEFRMEHATIKELFAALTQAPDFRRALASFNLSEPPLPDPNSDASGFMVIGFVGKRVEQPLRKISVHCKQATVRQILNEIVRQEGCANWSYLEFGRSNGLHGGESYYKLEAQNYCTEAEPVETNEN